MLHLCSYLCESVVNKTVDEGSFAHANIANEDDIAAVLSGLGQTMPDTSHSDKGLQGEL